MKRITAALLFVILSIVAWGEQPHSSDKYYTFKIIYNNEFMDVLFPKTFYVENPVKQGYEEGFMYSCFASFEDITIFPGIFWIITGYCYSPPKHDLSPKAKNVRRYEHTTSQGLKCVTVIEYVNGKYNRSDYFPAKQTAVTLDSIPMKFVPEAERLFRNIHFENKPHDGNELNGLQRIDIDSIITQRKIIKIVKRIKHLPAP